MAGGDNLPIDESSPRNDELPLLAQDVLYEIGMFRLSVARLYQGKDHDAWVEVLGVHTRNLISFFRSRRSKDDVIASDYVSGWNAETDGGKDLEWLAAGWESMNKRLFHLTAYRRRVPKVDDSRLVVDSDSHMSAILQRFFARLPNERRAWFHLDADPRPPISEGI